MLRTKVPKSQDWALKGKDEKAAVELVAQRTLETRFGSDTGIVRQNLQKRGKNEGNRAFPVGSCSGTFNRC